MQAEWLASAAVLSVMFAACAIFAGCRVSTALKLALIAGIGLRVAGSAFRLGVLYLLYGGTGDADGYFGAGVRYAEAAWRLDPTVWFDSTGWRSGTWIATQFIRYVSGVVVTFVGPSMFAVTLVFAMLAFVGLIAFVIAFHRTYPDTASVKYARWLCLFPALWYWPSSIGKEAIALFGLGLAVMGYVGRDDRPHWLPLVVGAFFVFATRPELAGVLIVAVIAAELAGFRGRWGVRRFVEVAAVLMIAIVGIRAAGNQLGIGGFDADSLIEYVESEPGRRLGGGSSVEAPSVGIAGLPFAVANALLRPFPWEADSALMLLSSVEIAGLWLIVWWRRRQVVAVLRGWRDHRFTRLAVVFTAIYGVALGMMASNLGLIARQRILVFPFVFLLVEGGLAMRRERVAPVSAAPVRRSGGELVPAS